MLRIETEREVDGRWIGEVPELPGTLAYGITEAEAKTKVTALALRVIADKIEHGEPMLFRSAAAHAMDRNRAIAISRNAQLSPMWRCRALGTGGE